MSQSVTRYPKALNEAYAMTSSEDYVENGRILKRSVAKVVDPRENFAGLKVSDFYLENVIAAGAWDTLRECKLSEGTLAGTDNVDAQLAAFDAAVVADAKQNNETKAE